MLTKENGADFYANEYCGRYAGEQLPIDRAAALLDTITFGRAGRVTDPALERKVRFAQCAIIDELVAESKLPALVASESTAHVSVTYREADSHARLTRCRAAVMLYLGDTNLLYRGGDL